MLFKLSSGPVEGLHHPGAGLRPGGAKVGTCSSSQDPPSSALLWPLFRGGGGEGRQSLRSGGRRKKDPTPSCPCFPVLHQLRFPPNSAARPSLQPLSPRPQQPVCSPLHTHHLDPTPPPLPLSKSLVHLTFNQCSPSLRSIPGTPYAITILPLHPLAIVSWKERFCGPFSMLGKLRFSCSRLHRDVDAIRIGRRWPASQPEASCGAPPDIPQPHVGFSQPTLACTPLRPTLLHSRCWLHKSYPLLETLPGHFPQWLLCKYLLCLKGVRQGSAPT